MSLSCRRPCERQNIKGLDQILNMNLDRDRNRGTLNWICGQGDPLSAQASNYTRNRLTKRLWRDDFIRVLCAFCLDSRIRSDWMPAIEGILAPICANLSINTLKRISHFATTASPTSRDLGAFYLPPFAILVVSLISFIDAISEMSFSLTAINFSFDFFFR